MPDILYDDKQRAADLKDIGRPVQIHSGWVTLLKAGQIATADNGGSDVVNPDTQVDAGNDEILDTRGRATLLLATLGYDDELSGITDPVVQFFGRLKSEGGEWMRLQTIARAISMTMTTDTAKDATDGTLKYTTVDIQNTVIDLMGCDEVIARVVTPLGGTGATNNAILRVKGI